MPIINLASGPRNISTALMYSFAQRRDCAVLDEPFYAVYLAKTQLPHPGADEVLAALPQQEDEVRQLIKRTNHKPVLFVKNMAHHMEVLREPFIEGAVNVFLIRNPSDIIASYSQVIETPTLRDLGIEYQVKLFEELKASGEQPVVLDSAEVVKDPEKTLKLLCAHCSIPFDRAMLSWSAGPKPYDGVWARYWYKNVHSTTGFERQQPQPRQVPPGLRQLSKEASALYEKLLPFSLKA